MSQPPPGSSLFWGLGSINNTARVSTAGSNGAAWTSNADGSTSFSFRYLLPAGDPSSSSTSAAEMTSQPTGPFGGNSSSTSTNAARMSSFGGGVFDRGSSSTAPNTAGTSSYQGQMRSSSATPASTSDDSIVRENAVFAKNAFGRNSPDQKKLKTTSDRKPTSVPRLGDQVRQCSQDVIRILVGPEKKLYQVHKAFLVHYSPYFEKALNGPFAEALSGEITLDHTDPRVFDHFVDWIYTQQLIAIPTEFLDSTTQKKQFLQLWILADYLQIPRLQNIAMDKLLVMKTGIQPDLYGWIYKNTTVESKLRTLVAYSVAARTNDMNFLRSLEDDPSITKEIMMDVVLAMGERMWVAGKGFRKPAWDTFHVTETQQEKEK